VTMAPQRRRTVLDADYRRNPSESAPPRQDARCGACIRWRKIAKPGTRFGGCHWPGIGPAPYWKATHPSGDLLTADCHGSGCAAFKEKRR
jgi:hypothetical protein